MPYMLEGNCVYKKNPDGSKGEKRGCSDTVEMAKAHMRALYAHESSKELQGELPTAKEFKYQFLTTKEGEKYRWTLITGSAFEDRDGEIISTKAFEDDCDRMELSGQYGELLWWHCDGQVHPERGEKEARPYLPLGECDLSLVYNKLNIESGLYYDNAVGEYFNSHAKEFGASKAFWHKAGEPQDGVYSYIRTKERSLLPRTKEANLLTRLFGGMKEKEMADNKDRIAALIEKLGEEKTNELLAQGKEMSEKAEKFLASKEQKEEPKPEAAKEMAKLVAASKEAKELVEGLAVSFKELQTKWEEASKELAQLKELSAAEDAKTKEEIAKLQSAMATLLGFQPKGANRFEASKEGKQPELTEQQKKMEKEADGQKTGFEGLTQWLITGERQAA